MRHLITLILVIVFELTLFGQEIKLKPEYENRSSYFITNDFSPFNQTALDSVFHAFKVKSYKNFKNEEFSKFKLGNAYYHLSLLNWIIKFDTTRIINQFKLNKTIYKTDSICIKGFWVTSAEGKKLCKNYSMLLLSAYLEETDSSYLNQETNFILLPLKSNAEFWKRNFINIGYGMSYATQNNPYISGGKFATGLGYVLEALHYIPILGGGFFGKTTNDKIVIPIAGLSSLLVWKTIFFGLIMGKPTIKNYNNFARWKYKTPKSLIF